MPGVNVRNWKPVIWNDFQTIRLPRENNQAAANPVRLRIIPRTPSPAQVSIKLITVA